MLSPWTLSITWRGVFELEMQKTKQVVLQERNPEPMIPLMVKTELGVDRDPLMDLGNLICNWVLG